MAETETKSRDREKAGEDAENLEHSYTIGRSVKC